MSLCAALMGLVPFATIMSPLNPTLANLSGTYRGQYGTFVLFPNGTFKQRYTDQTGRSYSTAGKWDLEGDGVAFYNILLPKGEPYAIGKPELCSGFGGAALHAIDDSINFDEDDGVQIRRVSRSLQALKDIPAYTPPAPAKPSSGSAKYYVTVRRVSAPSAH